MEPVISIENAKLVAKLERKDGRIKVGEALGWQMTSFDDDAQMQESILLDFLYESLMFGIQKGMPWAQVCGILGIAAEFQKETIGQPLSSAIKAYRELTKKYLRESAVSEGNLRLFTSHLFETYMAHFNLYQIVFTSEREPLSVRHDLVVTPPPEPYPLDEAKPLSIWEYEHTMEEIQGEESSRLNDLKSQEESILKEMEEKQPLNQTGESDTLDRQQVTQLITDAIQHQASQTEKLLQTQVEQRHEDLSFYLEKTALPRPEILGPPPRTKEPPRLSAKSRASGKLEGKVGGSAKSKKSKKSAKP